MNKQQKDAEILLQIQTLKVDHPFWGYRRVWAYIKYRLNQQVNKKRVYRIMKEHDLLVTPNLRLRATRDNHPYRNKPHATRPNQFWGTDMTKIMLRSFGWIYLVIVLDWCTKKIVGYSISHRSRAVEWLDALQHACNTQFPQGILTKKETLKIVSDNGTQPTSKQYMQACSVLEIEQVFASYNNPKGNADTERVMRTIKEDFMWVREFPNPIAFAEEFKIWVEKYNHDFPHSSLHYQTPCQYEKEQLLLATKI